jgi:hypothetical protein
MKKLGGMGVVVVNGVVFTFLPRGIEQGRDRAFSYGQPFNRNEGTLGK